MKNITSEVENALRAEFESNIASQRKAFEKTLQSLKKAGGRKVETKPRAAHGVRRQQVLDFIAQSNGSFDTRALARFMFPEVSKVTSFETTAANIYLAEFIKNGTVHRFPASSGDSRNTGKFYYSRASK